MTSKPPDKEPSCINCGGAGHWAIACPEPTRQVPAGLQGQRPADEKHHRGGGKHGCNRHKGPIVNKYSPPVPAPSQGSHPPFASSYGGYSHHDVSYPPPNHTPHGHYGGPTPPPPGAPPSHSPPPHLAGAPPHSVPPHASPYGPPGSYATPLRPPPAPAPYGQPPGYPNCPPPPPPPQSFPRQHEAQHQHQYYQQHPPGQHYPPPLYNYSPPQTHPFSQPQYAPPPPPPSSSPGAGNPFYGMSTHPPSAGPPHMSHSPPGPSTHHSPNPPGSTPHGPPPSLPSLPNIGGPGSLIRVLPPKPTVQVPPADRGHGRRKDRNKSWRNKRNKDKHASGPPKAGGDSGGKDETKSASEATKSLGLECRGKGQEAETRGAAEDGKVGQTKSDAGDIDAASRTSDKPEEGEILDEDPEWEWDEKTIFKEPKEVHLADPVAGPLPPEYTDHVLLPPAWNAKCITSKFVNPDNKDDFCRPVRETPLWDRYKHTVPFGSPRSARPPLTAAELHELLETRRSSLNPGPRREPKVPNRKQGSPQGRDGAKCQDRRGRALSRERSISPEGRSTQKDRRPVIDSYRPNYEGGRRSRSLSRDRRRRRSDNSPPRRQDSPSSPAPFFQLPLEERSRDSSPESDLNSLENELLGLSPKSPSEDENKKAGGKKAEETKKRPNDDAIPKSKRRRVQVDSAFGRRW